MQVAELDARWAEFERKIADAVAADLDGTHDYGHGISGWWSLPPDGPSVELEAVEGRDGTLEKIRVTATATYTYSYPDGSGSWEPQDVLYDAFLEGDAIRLVEVTDGEAEGPADGAA